MGRIVIVEDDRELNQGISYALEKEGYTTVSAFSLKEAKEICQGIQIDLVILDVNLPDGEGFSFCEWLKKQMVVPVLFLSARDLESDILKGYDFGAEDYVTKPFSMKVLQQKIKVILKREDNKSNIFDDDFLEINFDEAKVKIGGEECSVTPTEFRILKLFIEHQGQLLTYAVLLEYLWDAGAQFVDKHALAVNINRLRKKIGTKEHRYISNVYGMGYLWK